MNPVTLATTSKAAAMAMPRNQSAFQNDFFMTLPRVSRGRHHNLAGRGESLSEVDLFHDALRAGELRQLRRDDEVLEPHARRLEEGDLVGGSPSGTGARDDLAQLGEARHVQAPLFQRRQE